jgi:DNA excision repair protein ERCC-1
VQIPTLQTYMSVKVHPNQRGNPVISSLSHTWEYDESLLCDYAMGPSSGLFLSLKYHQLFPDYIYKRIDQCKSAFKVLLVMVDTDSYCSFLILDIQVF